MVGRNHSTGFSAASPMAMVPDVSSDGWVSCRCGFVGCWWLAARVTLGRQPTRTCSPLSGAASALIAYGIFLRINRQTVELQARLPWHAASRRRLTRGLY